MVLRYTMFILPGEDSQICRIEIYTADNVQSPGYWNIETNHVLLSPEAYSQFRSLTSQKQQQLFFNSLKKVSSLVIA